MGSPDRRDEAKQSSFVKPTAWKRWVDGGDNLHLHKVCSFVPQVSLTDRPPYLAATPESDSPPTFEDPDSENGEEQRFVFVRGVPRQALRHTPLVIFVAAVVLFGAAEFLPGIEGVSSLMPAVDDYAVFLVLWLAPTPALLYLLYKVGIIGTGAESFASLIVAYGLPLALLVGAFVSLALVFGADEPSALDPNVVFVSGYLLTLLVGGQIFYDTILRTEHLFVNLPKTDIVDNEDEYYRLLSEMNDSLSTSVFGISAATLFGLIFAGQFAGVWFIGDGPQHLDYGLNVLVNTALNVVLVAATFQFVIIIYYASKLFNDDGEYEHVLGYEPFHVDGHAGYRDLGRFAVRFNFLIGLGGVYLVYRLYATGMRAIPPEGLAGFTDQLELVLWALNYAIPISVFAVILVAWAYLAFWGMHVKMVREKDRIAWLFQGDPDSDGHPGAGAPVSELESGPNYEYIEESPEWPVNPDRLKGIITGTFLPLLFTVPGLLF